MPDLTITSISLTSSRARGTTAQAGSAIAVGELVYLDSATGKYELADASAAATADLAGIALTAAAADEYFVYLANESIDLGAILTAGEFYYLSATSGKVCPHDDLVSTNIVSAIGYATSTSELKLNIVNTGVAI
jgi:hypothetical protein